MLRSLDLRPVVASLVELATALGCCASPWSLTPSSTAARSWLPGGVGGSWGAGSGGCRPRGSPAPASPARTAACLSPGAWPGGLPWPWNPGDGGHRGMPQGRQGQAMEPTKSAMHEGRRPSAGSGAGLVGGRMRLGVGHASNRPARSIHPGRGGRTRLPPRGRSPARSRLLAMGPAPPSAHSSDTRSLRSTPEPRSGSPPRISTQCSETVAR